MLTSCLSPSLTLLFIGASHPLCVLFACVSRGLLGHLFSISSHVVFVIVTDGLFLFASLRFVLDVVYGETYHITIKNISILWI